MRMGGRPLHRAAALASNEDDKPHHAQQRELGRVRKGRKRNNRTGRIKGMRSGEIERNLRAEKELAQ